MSPKAQPDSSSICCHVIVRAASVRFPRPATAIGSPAPRFSNQRGGAPEWSSYGPFSWAEEAVGLPEPEAEAAAVGPLEPEAEEAVGLPGLEAEAGEAVGLPGLGAEGEEAGLHPSLPDRNIRIHSKSYR
jgi:hypothetical protein